MGLFEADRKRTRVATDRSKNGSIDKNGCINFYAETSGVAANPNPVTQPNQERSASSPIKMPKLKIAQSGLLTKNANTSKASITQIAQGPKGSPLPHKSKDQRKLEKIKSKLRHTNQSNCIPIPIENSQSNPDPKHSSSKIVDSYNAINSFSDYFQANSPAPNNNIYNLLKNDKITEKNYFSGGDVLLSNQRKASLGVKKYSDNLYVGDHLAHQNSLDSMNIDNAVNIDNLDFLG